MFKSWWGSQENPGQPSPQGVPESTSYPSPSSFQPAIGSRTSSGTFSEQRLSDGLQSPSEVSPADAAGVIGLLKDKSVDELKKLLSDKDAYSQLLNSVEQVKYQNNLRNELRKETLQLAGENLEREPLLTELQNQCNIIRRTELAAAQEKLNDLQKRKNDVLTYYAPQALLHRLEEAMRNIENESESLHRQLLDEEMDLASFVQKYKKHRNTYHRYALKHIAAKTTAVTTLA